MSCAIESKEKLRCENLPEIWVIQVKTATEMLKDLDINVTRSEPESLRRTLKLTQPKFSSIT